MCTRVLYRLGDWRKLWHHWISRRKYCWSIHPNFPFQSTMDQLNFAVIMNDAQRWDYVNRAFTCSAKISKDIGLKGSVTTSESLAKCKFQVLWYEHKSSMTVVPDALKERIIRTHPHIPLTGQYWTSFKFNN